MPKHSNLPEKIISLLIENPAITREEIKKRLGVSYQSVQKHLLKMQKDKIVTPAFLVDETKLKKKKIFWIIITTKNPNETKRESKNKPEDEQNNDMGVDYQRRLCNEIAKSFLMKSDLVGGLIFGEVHIVIGGTYDIILRVFADDADAVGRYVTRFLRSRPAIVSTSTAWSLTESTNESI